MHPRLIGYCLVNSDLEVMSILWSPLLVNILLKLPEGLLGITWLCHWININYLVLCSVVPQSLSIDGD